MRALAAVILLAGAACGDAASSGVDASPRSAPDAAQGFDAAPADAAAARPDARAVDPADAASTAPDAAGRADAAVQPDAAAALPDATAALPDATAALPDAAAALPDAAAALPDATVVVPDAAGPGMADAGGVIRGGPCMSGAAGATAYRIRWADAAGTAQVIYEVNGLPDRSRDHAGAFGYVIGFRPQFVDRFLAQGGLLLDSSDFVDLELSTAGLVSIESATLSIYGRSFNTTASGSFNWQTFAGVGSSPTNSVSNVAPYAWYSADMTTEIDAGDDRVLIRIKAGPASGALAVNRIELCVRAR